MKKENLELRMYFFVPYQLTGIQQGIQCGHAALEYAKQFGHTPEYKDFIDNWKTWIVLNGGSTNSRNQEVGIDPECKPIGSLNQILESLQKLGPVCSYFREPDLQDAVTAVCFICDERVWNYEKYPDFDEAIYGSVDDHPWKECFYKTDNGCIMSYDMWLSKCIGGSINLELRKIIRGKRLA